MNSARFLTYLCVSVFFLCEILFGWRSASAQPLVFDGFVSPRGGNTPIFKRASYDYSPSLMRDTDGKYKMWWCGSVSTLPAKWKDVVFYSESRFLDRGWSVPTVVFSPTTGQMTFDKDHVCDPSVIKVSGIYYMFYGGIGNLTNYTAIGVAQSSNGKSWMRLNGGSPIVLPHVFQEYGAGQPSVVFLNGWFYMLYHDSQGADGYGSYVLRSKSVLFPNDPNQTQELSRENGVVEFWPISAARRTTYKIREIANSELIFDRALNYFTVGISGDPGLLSLAVFTTDLKEEIGDTNWPGTWTEGPGILRAPDGKSIPNPNSNIFQAQSQCVISIDEFRSVGTADHLTWELAYSGADLIANKRCPRGVLPFDFDRDANSDQVVYRRSTSRFYVNRSNLGIQEFVTGGSTSTPIKGDFDGDGVADFAVITPANGYLDWRIFYSSGGSRYQPTWGLVTDRIAVGDFNGDRKDDIAVFRNGDWWIVYDNGNVEGVSWGRSGDIPVASDYDGDNVTDFGIYRPSTKTWYLKYRNAGTRSVQWGNVGDIPIAEDFLSDGFSSIGLWRPSNGTWYIRSLRNNDSLTVQWGLPGDVPLVGDFNGDGVVDLTVWRPSTGNWYQNMRNGINKTVQWGLSADLLPTNRCIGSNFC